MDKIPGCDDLPVYGDMGITLGGKPLYFSKDFLIYLPKGVAPEVLAELDEAVAKMQADPQFQEDMANRQDTFKRRGKGVHIRQA